MAQQDRYSNPRENGGRGEHGRQFEDQNWSEGRDSDQDDNPQWGRHQPRQGGAFEDRYAGRGGGESRGNEASQRGRWREQSYGSGRYENEDHLRAGGSYGGQYDTGDSGRYYSSNEGSGSRDWGRGEQRGYGGGRNQDPRQERGAGFGQGWQRGQNEYEQNVERNYGQGAGQQRYGSQTPGSGTSGRYGSDYATTGMELRGQWDRGFSDMSRGTSGGYGQSDSYGGRSGYSSSWSGGVNQPQRQSFRGRGPKGYQRSDERLKEIICERLMDDPNIDASEITVEVRNLEVTLEGTVDDRREKYEIEEFVERCGGVKDVKNQLRVRARGSESGDDRSSTSSSPNAAAPQAGSEANYGTSGRAGISGGTSSSAGSSTSSSTGSSGRSK